jgi:hypothetical protein
MVTWREGTGPMGSTQWFERSAYRALNERLGPDIPAAYGLRSLEGYSAFAPARETAFLDVARHVFRKYDQDLRLFDVGGVKYIVSQEALPGTRLTLVRDGPVKVYRSPGSLGPCWMVPEVAVFPEARRVANFLASSEFHPDRVAVLEGPIEALTPTPDRFRGAARAVRLDSTRMEFEAESNAAGLLVINAAAYDPGWAATVDGTGVPVLPADLMFMAIRLPAGTHRVALRYDPLSYTIGRQVSLATLVILVLVLAWTAQRKRARIAPA